MDDQHLLETLTISFMDDPLYRWLYPDGSTRPLALRDNFRLTLSLARERGYVETTPSGEGVALWTDPGVELLDDPTPLLVHLERWAPERVGGAQAGMAECSRYSDPSDAVLHVLAVHPAHQGRGVAAGLLSPTLRRHDRDGTSAYVESSNARNLNFYRRCGFRNLGDVHIPNGGPTMPPMRRFPV